MIQKELFAFEPNHGALSLYIDGASRGNPGPSGIGVVFYDGHQKVLWEFGKFIGETTNNIAEYTALIHGLQEALIHRIGHLSIYTDSQLLARQLQGAYKVKDPQLKRLYQQAQSLLKEFTRTAIHHLPRENNRRADKLANQAIDAMKL